MAYRYNRLTPARLTYRYNDLPAQGFKVWSVLAGTTTLATTYTNKSGATNTNPIVLDANGQCTVWAVQSLDLIFCLPTSTGPTDGIIYTDPDFEYIAQTSDIAAADPGTTNNNYVAATTPPYTSIPDGFSLSMIPDKDSEATLVDDGGVTSPKFTGTGVNDLDFSGPYLGTTAGSIFTVEMLAAFESPPVAPTAVENVAAGAVTVGNHYVKLTAVTAAGETTPGAASGVVAAAGARKIDVSGIPAIGGAITGYRVYMTKAGGAIYYLVATVTTTTYTINVADAALTVAAPAANTTGDGTDADLVRWKKDGGAWHQVAITALANTPQVMAEGVGFIFSVKTGHTEGDVWTQTVMSPPRLNFCGLGGVGTPKVYPLIYKNVDGTLKALDGGDIKQDIPAHLDYSLTQNCWILLNPSLPVLQEIQPQFIIHEVSGNYVISDTDARHFLNCSGAITITLPSCADFANKDVWIASKDGSTITVNVAGGTDKIYGPFDTIGATSKTVGPGWDLLRLASNGAYWKVIQVVYPEHGEITITATAPWVAPLGVTRVYVDGAAGGGGGGAGSIGFGGGGGGAGQQVKGTPLTVVPGTSYTITIGAKGVGGISGGAAATAGGNTSFGALLTLTGGAAGGAAGAGAGTGGAAGGAGGQKGTDGDATYGGFGGGGIYGPGGVSFPGTPTAGGGYGSGGGAGYGGGGNGADAAQGFMTIRW